MLNEPRFTVTLLKFGKIARRLYFVIAVTVCLALLPLTSMTYLIYLVMTFISFAIFAASWDLLYSYSGQLSLGQALPFGLGGIFTAVFSSWYHVPLLLAAPLAILISTLGAGAVGLSTLRLKPAYQGLAILLVSQVLYWVASYGIGGDQGVSVKSPIFGYPSTDLIYGIGVALFFLSMTIMHSFETSRLRVKLLAVKQDPVAAEVSTIDVQLYKSVTFLISFFFAGLAGSYYALFLTHVDFSIFGIPNSFLALGMAVIGGVGEIGGSILGAAIVNILLVALPIWFSLAIAYIIYGVALILLILFFPKGAMGFLYKLVRRK